jgi:hypothetical protein
VRVIEDAPVATIAAVETAAVGTAAATERRLRTLAVAVDGWPIVDEDASPAGGAVSSSPPPP